MTTKAAFAPGETTVPRPGRLLIVAVAVVAGLLAGCGSSPSASPAPAASATAKVASPMPSSMSAVCKSAEELRHSVEELTHVKVGQGTVDEVKSDLAKVEANFTALTMELRNASSAETGAVTSALDKLKSAVSDFSAHPSGNTLHGVAASVGGLTTAVGNLLTSISPHCGSASASPAS